MNALVQCSSPLAPHHLVYYLVHLGFGIASFEDEILGSKTCLGNRSRLRTPDLTPKTCLQTPERVLNGVSRLRKVPCLSSKSPMPPIPLVKSFHLNNLPRLGT